MFWPKFSVLVMKFTFSMCVKVRVQGKMTIKSKACRCTSILVLYIPFHLPELQNYVYIFSSRYPEKYAKHRRSRSKTPSPGRSRSRRSRSRSRGRHSKSQRHSHSRSPHNRNSSSHGNKLSHSSVTYASSLAAELSKHRRAREAREAALLAAKGKNPKDSRSSSSKSHSNHHDVPVESKDPMIVKSDRDPVHILKQENVKHQSLTPPPPPLRKDMVITQVEDKIVMKVEVVKEEEGYREEIRTIERRNQERRSGSREHSERREMGGARREHLPDQRGGWDGSRDRGRGTSEDRRQAEEQRRTEKKPVQELPTLLPKLPLPQVSPQDEYHSPYRYVTMVTVMFLIYWSR